MAQSSDWDYLGEMRRNISGKTNTIGEEMRAARCYIVAGAFGFLLQCLCVMAANSGGSSGFDADQFNLKEFLTADVGKQKRDDIQKVGHVC